MTALGSYEFKGSAPETTLAAGIDNAVLALSVAAGTGYPTGASAKKFVLSIGEGGTYEKVLCSARSGNDFTIVSRGFDDTTAVAHSAGEKVRHVLPAAKAQEWDDFVSAGTLIAIGTGTYAGLTVSSAKPKRALLDLTTSVQTVYTCPAGKKTITLSVHFRNDTGSSAVLDVYIVPSGGTAGDTTNHSINSGAITTNNRYNQGMCIPLVAGDTVQMKSSVSGTKVFLNLIEMDDTMPLVQVKGTISPGDGDKVIYTCPSGKVALPFHWNDVYNNVVVGGHAYNAAGVSGTLTSKIKRVGGSPLFHAFTEAIGSTNWIYRLANTFVSVGLPILEAGDALTMAFDQTSLLFWLPIVEFPA